jgi:hypothetical protein
MEKFNSNLEEKMYLMDYLEEPLVVHREDKNLLVIFQTIYQMEIIKMFKIIIKKENNKVNIILIIILKVQLKEKEEQKLTNTCQETFLLRIFLIKKI